MGVMLSAFLEWTRAGVAQKLHEKDDAGFYKDVRVPFFVVP